MIKKLQSVIARYNELSDLMNKPDAVSDMKYFTKIEHIHLSNSDIYKYNKNMIFEYIMFLYKQNYKHSLSVEYISNKGINLGNQNLILSNFSS